MLCLCFCLVSLKIAFVSGDEGAKQKANGEKSYVLYERGTCVDVKSEAPCPVSGKLPAEYGWNYEYTNWLVRTIPLKDISDRGCKGALGAFLCTQLIPKCFESEDDDLQALCKSAQNKCSNTRIKPETCDDVTPVKVNRTTRCIAVEETAVGKCPKQKRKMLEDDVQFHKLWADHFRTLETFLDPSTLVPLFSSECQDNLKSARCAARYCSDDEMRILVDYTREECTRDISCVVDRIKSLSPDDPHGLKKKFQRSLDRNTAYCLLFPKGSDVTTSGSADRASFQFLVLRLSLMFITLITAM